jgi:hypothetical protein
MEAGMTITIHLSPELETPLLVEAARTGVEPSEYAQTAVAEKLAGAAETHRNPLFNWNEWPGGSPGRDQNIPPG